MRKFTAAVAIAGLLSIGAIAGAALAQDPAAVPVTTTGDTFIDFGSALQNILVTVVLPLMATLLSAVGVWVLSWIKTKTGLQIETSYAESMARWATNRAGEFLAKFDTIAGMRIDVGNVMIADLADSALTRIPDALDYFKAKGQPVTNEALQKMIIQKIGILTAAGTTPTEVTVTNAPGAPPVRKV